MICLICSGRIKKNFLRERENCLGDTFRHRHVPSSFHLSANGTNATFTNFLRAFFAEYNIKRNMDFALDTERHLSIGSVYRWMGAGTRTLVDSESREVGRISSPLWVHRHFNAAASIIRSPLWNIFSILFINNFVDVPLLGKITFVTRCGILPAASIYTLRFCGRSFVHLSKRTCATSQFGVRVHLDDIVDTNLSKAELTVAMIYRNY